MSFCKNMEFLSSSDIDTFNIGFNLGQRVKKGEVYAIFADMGMGKTVLAKGFAKGLGIDENVNSPTFTIVKEYHSGRLPFYHFDVYRIGSVDEMEQIGYIDYFYGEGVTLIEWADLITDILPDNTINIYITGDRSDMNFRNIRVEMREMN